MPVDPLVNKTARVWRTGRRLCTARLDGWLTSVRKSYEKRDKTLTTDEHDCWRSDARFVASPRRRVWHSVSSGTIQRLSFIMQFITRLSFRLPDEWLTDATRIVSRATHGDSDDVTVLHAVSIHPVHECFCMHRARSAVATLIFTTALQV